MANVLLVNAPHTDEGEEIRRFSRPWPPLDLLNCAALLAEADHEVELLDYRAESIPAAVRDAAVERADRIVITTTPLDRWQCPTLNPRALFAFIRRFPADRTWVAGAHGTMAPEWVLSETNVAGLIVGEPEGAMAAVVGDASAEEAEGLATSKNGEVTVRPAPRLDMTRFPIPAFHLLKLDSYTYELLGDRFLLFETARGCPFGCTFCSREMYGKPVRRKEVAQVLDEIDCAREQTGFRHAYFIDLEFTFHREPVVEICEGILSRGHDFRWACQTRFDQVDDELLRLMRRAGCRLIHFGVETGSERQVKALKKGLKLETIRQQHAVVKAVGIETALFFLIGHPGETADEQLSTIDFACQLDPTYASFHIASPYPGTVFHEQTAPFDSAFPSHDSHSHKLDDLERMRRRALRSFYLRPRQVLRQLHPRRLPRALRGARLLMEFLAR